MAASVTPNLTDITLGESADNGYWTGTDGNSTEIYRQGSASQGWIVSKNTLEIATFSMYSKFGSGGVDMSATGTHVYIAIRCDIAPFIDYLSVNLLSNTAEGSATDGENVYRLVDNTGTYPEWYGEWRTFIIDLASTYSTTGTLDTAAVTSLKVLVDNQNSGNIRSIENTYIDTIRFGTGLTITGTDWDWDDIATIDAGNTYKWDIIRKVGPGVYQVQGQLTIGNGATTTTPSCSNETIYFFDASIAGEQGGPLGSVASTFYKIVVQGSGCTVTLSNMSFLASTNTPFDVDFDDSGLGTGSVAWQGGVVSNAGSVYLKSSQSYTGITFVNCYQIVPSTCTFESNTISDFVTDSGTEDAALLWPGGTTVKNCTFINCQHAIEITQTSNQTYDNLTFTNCTYDTHLNNGGSSIQVSLNNGSNATTYQATGGGTVTYVGASVSVTVTVVTTGGTEIQNARVILEAKDGTGPFPYEESVTIANSGTTATVTHSGHGMATGDYVVIRGASHALNNGVFQITVSDTNTYTYTMSSAPGSSPTGTITSTFVALYGLSNASGIVTTSRVYSSDQPVTGHARKSSAAPYYKTADLVGSVDSADGYSATAVMILDQ